MEEVELTAVSISVSSDNRQGKISLNCQTFPPPILPTQTCRVIFNMFYAKDLKCFQPDFVSLLYFIHVRLHDTLTPARTSMLGLCHDTLTLTPARTPRLGLCHDTLTPARTPRLGVCHDTLTLTQARTPRLGLCHDTLTPARTPRLGLCHDTLTQTPARTPGLGCVTTH